VLFSMVRLMEYEPLQSELEEKTMKLNRLQAELERLSLLLEEEERLKMDAMRVEDPPLPIPISVRSRVNMHTYCSLHGAILSSAYFTWESWECRSDLRPRSLYF